MKFLLVFCLYNIEESALLAFLGLRLFGVCPTFKQIVSISFMQSLVVSMVRYVYTYEHIPFGSNSFFSLLFLVVIIRIVTRIPWQKAIASGTIAIIILMLSETLLLPVMLNLFKYNSVEKLLQNPFPYILVGYCILLPIMALALLVYYTKFSFVNKRE